MMAAAADLTTWGQGLPAGAARLVGRRFGDLHRLVNRRRRHAILDRLTRALPQLSGPTLQRIVRESFRHRGSVPWTLSAACRLDPVRLCRRMHLVGWENLDPPRAPGLLLVSAALGVPEIAFWTVGLWREGLCLLETPTAREGRQHHLETQRHRCGVRAPARPLEAVQALSRGGRVALLLDQPGTSDEEISVRLLRDPATLSAVPARLSLATGAPAVLLFAYLEPGARFRLLALPPVAPAGEGDRAVRELTGRYSEILESEIRQHPEQWEGWG